MTGTPFIPERITVHLGPPDSNAENVSITFPDYVKNVASIEIFPNWPENSLRSNIYVISTFALNRIYTEWYRAKGYDFDITNSTQYDQKFINGREIFENISQLTDELFSNYVRRQGYVEPLFTQFCNGTTVTCEGLSQWGTVDLAKQGMTPYEILQYYYGDNIEIVRDAQVMTNTPSYPGIELRLGSFGNDVRTIQVQLNRIARNYPAIQKISSVDGAFGVQTEDAVKTFQQIFNMPQTGVVDKATWYKIAYIFTSVKKLAELNSEGLRLEEVDKQFKEDLSPGMQNNEVKILQYFLAVIGAYYDSIMPVDITGYYGSETEASVRSFQKTYGLPETGTVNRATWFDIYRAYDGIIQSIPIDDGEDVILFQGTILKEGMSNDEIKRLQEYLTFINQTYPNIPAVNNTGYFGPVTRSSVLAFQRQFGLPQNGLVGAVTWNEIVGLYSDLKYGFDKRPYQNPGYTIK